ncbi:MAG: hypothetical protein ACI4JZ_06330 [Oscillospiraceae bacterium]
MKKYIALAAFAAILLCGCADDEGTTSTSRQSSSTSTSSSSVDPYVSQLMSDLDISIPEGGTTSFSASSSKGRMTVTEKKAYPAEKTFKVPSNTHLYLKNGGELTVEGKFVANEGSEVTIESGGALIFNDESSLNCDLYIEEGGKLVIGENGKVSGSGTIYTFSNDCIENSKNIENNIKVTG